MQGETLQEEPKEKTAEKKDAFAKYTAKDSVFSTLFRDKKYLMQLYLRSIRRMRKRRKMRFRTLQ